MTSAHHANGISVNTYGIPCGKPRNGSARQFADYDGDARQASSAQTICYLHTDEHRLTRPSDINGSGPDQIKEEGYANVQK